MDVAPLEDVAEVAPPKGAASSAPERSHASDKHPLDDKLLKDLADGDPIKERELKRAATAPEHLRSHFPKNPFCKICRIAKDTSMRVSRKPDGKADDMLDPPGISSGLEPTNSLLRRSSNLMRRVNLNRHRMK